jgi:hypothetical protein
MDALDMLTDDDGVLSEFFSWIPAWHFVRIKIVEDSRLLTNVLSGFKGRKMIDHSVGQSPLFLRPIRYFLEICSAIPEALANILGSPRVSGRMTVT